MTKKIFLILLALVLAVSIGIVGCTAPAEEEEEEEEEPEIITLRYGTVAPETHPMVQQVTIPWQEKITEETNGVIQWENYCATLLNPLDVYAEIQAGVVDIGTIMAPYEPTGFAIAKVIALFFIGSPSMEADLAIYQQLTETFPEIEAEFSEVKLLECGITQPAMNLVTTNVPVRSLADLAGLQIKTRPAYIQALAELNASGVPMSTVDFYSSLATGVIDGGLTETETLKSANLAELVSYHTTLDISDGCNHSTGMNRDTWNSLPEDIQQVFEDNMQYYSDLLTESWNEATTEGIAFGALNGVEFIELAPEELEELYDILKATAEESAATLDGMGLPGTDIYTEAQRLIAEY